MSVPQASLGIGLIALTIGVFMMAWAAKNLLSPETGNNPRASLQLDLLLDQGALIAALAVVLAIGAFYVRHRERPGSAQGPADEAGEPGWHRALLAFAVLILVGVIVLSVVPTPSDNFSFSPSNFKPLAQPTNLTTYGAYFFTNRQFRAVQGAVVTVSMHITWTSNATGAVLFGGDPGNYSVYVASSSSPRDSPKPASSNVVPYTGFFVLVVWLGRCATLTIGECANTTVAMETEFRVSVPTTYLTAQVGGSIVGSAFVVVSAAGTRRRS